MIDLLIESATFQLSSPLLYSLVLALLVLMLGRSIEKRRRVMREAYEDEDQLDAPLEAAVSPIITVNVAMVACDASSAPDSELPPLRKLGKFGIVHKVEALDGVPEPIETVPTREFVRSRSRARKPGLRDEDDQTTQFQRPCLGHLWCNQSQSQARV